MPDNALQATASSLHSAGLNAGVSCPKATVESAYILMSATFGSAVLVGALTRNNWIAIGMPKRAGLALRARGRSP